MNEILYLVLLSVGAFVALFLISKLLGKKQIAQLEFVDYVIGISIGSIAAQMAIDTSDHPWYFYMIALGIFFLLSLIITFLGRKSPIFKKFLKGKPATLIYDGKIDFDQLYRSKLDINDLLGMCRTLGYFDIADIAYAVFETSGNLSVLPKGAQKPTVISDIKENYSQAELPCYLVIDGHISYSGLDEIGKNKKWLFNELKIDNKEDLEQYILISYDTKNKKLLVHKK